MDSADYAVARCLSICPSVCPSTTRRDSVDTAEYILNFFTVRCPTILVFLFQTLWQYSECKEVWRNLDFQQISRFSSEMMQVRATVTMEGEYETVPMLSNGAISNDSDIP